MRKRLISVFIIVVLLSSFSFTLAADSDDPVLDSIGSGWSDSNTGYPTEANTSWFRYIFQWVRGLFTDIRALQSGWGASSLPSGYANSWFQKIRSDLDNSYSLSTGYQTGWSFTDNSLVVSAPSGYANSSDAAIIQGLQYINYDVDQIRISAASIATTSSSASTHLFNIRSFLKDIHDVIANPTDIAMRNNMESSYSAVNDDFMSGNGGTTSSVKASSSEYGDVKGLGSIVRGLEPSGRDSSNIADAFGDGENSLMGWFTSRNAQELNPIMNQTRRSASIPDDGFVDYLAPNIEAIEGSRSND